MKFFSSYNRPPSKCHEACPCEQTDYIKDEATGELVECGKIPFYERIQSHYESTTLSYKLKRFALGDSTALGRPSGTFGDFTEIPSDLRAVLDSRQKVQADFNALESDIRAIFSDSFEEFEKSVRDGTAEKRIKDGLKSRTPTAPQSGASQSSEQTGGGN